MLHVSTATTWRGGEQQLAYLFESKNLKVEQYLLCPKNSPLYTRLQEFTERLYHYSKRISLDLRLAHLVGSITRTLKVDIVHAHDSHAHTAVILSKKFFSCPSRIFVHRRVAFEPSSSIFSKWKYHAKEIEKYICVSKRIRDILLDYGCNSDSLNVVYDGVPPHEKQSEDRILQFKKQFAIPADRYIVGNIAALSDNKDHLTFVRTAAILISSGIPLHFVIIGSDAGVKDRVEAEIQSLRITEFITLTGFVENAKSYLSVFDLFLFTSKEEGLGTSLLDAMVAGIPVVATRAGGIPEIIQTDDNGLLAGIGDIKTLARNCEAILKNPDLQQKLVAEAKERARFFSVEQMRKKTLDMYLKQVNG